MTTNPNQKPDELGERLSAYLDGELPVEERPEIERLLASDPAAQRLADELRSVGKTCAEMPSPAFGDLTSSVLADAERRKAAGEGFVDRLEPEGEFGLPFGRSSRGWAWAGVAVAASLVIGFYGRPAPPSARTIARKPPASSSLQMASFSPAVQQAIPQMRQTMPQLRVVRIAITPERLEQLLAQRGIQVRPASGSPEPASRTKDQLMLVSAEGPRLANLMSDLEKEESIFRVEVDRDLPTPPTGSLGNSGAAPAQSVAIRITIQIRPGQPPTIHQSVPSAKIVSHGRVPVLFVIQAKQP